MIAKIKAKIGAVVLQNEGGKRILNKKHASIAVIIFSAIGLASQLLPPLLKSDIPKGSITKSDTSLIKEKSEAKSQPSNTETNLVTVIMLLFYCSNIL